MIYTFIYLSGLRLTSGIPAFHKSCGKRGFFRDKSVSFSSFLPTFKEVYFSYLQITIALDFLWWIIIAITVHISCTKLLISNQNFTQILSLVVVAWLRNNHPNSQTSTKIDYLPMYCIWYDVTEIINILHDRRWTIR